MLRVTRRAVRKEVCGQSIAGGPVVDVREIAWIVTTVRAGICGGAGENATPRTYGTSIVVEYTLNSVVAGTNSAKTIHLRDSGNKVHFIQQRCTVVGAVVPTTIVTISNPTNYRRDSRIAMNQSDRS